MMTPMYKTLQRTNISGKTPFSLSKLYMDVKTLQKFVNTNLSVLSKDKLKQLKKDIIDLQASVQKDLSEHTAPSHVTEDYEDVSGEIRDKLFEIDKWILK